MAKNILKIGSLLILTSLMGCFSTPAMMTYSKYNDVQLGTSIEQLEAQMGTAYSVHKKKDGTTEYEYIERIDAGNTLVAENHYFLIVQDGKVVGKYMSRQSPPAYDLIYQSEPNYPDSP